MSRHRPHIFPSPDVRYTIIPRTKGFHSLVPSTCIHRHHPSSLSLSHIHFSRQGKRKEKTKKALNPRVYKTFHQNIQTKPRQRSNLQKRKPGKHTIHIPRPKTKRTPALPPRQKRQHRPFPIPSPCPSEPPSLQPQAPVPPTPTSPSDNAKAKAYTSYPASPPWSAEEAEPRACRPTCASSSCGPEDFWASPTPRR